MAIKNILLTDFRNFKKKELKFSEGITVITGPNASGKTNILEGLFLLSSGKSFKAAIEEEMVNYNSSITGITGVTSSARLEIKLTRGENGWPRKKLLVNGVPKRLVDFAGLFKVTLFGPRDLDLVTGPPSLRRRFLDFVLSQVDREYHRASLSYEKGLRQRNRLLLRIKEEGIPRGNLTFWDQLLIKNVDYISAKREEFINSVNNTNFKFQINTNYQLEYDSSAISEGRLERYAREEVAAATTLVGPHRDDMQFQITNFTREADEVLQIKRNLGTYGSRGEQRMGVLWLKLAELAFVEAKTGERPTLLLDDILSELDREHRKVVIKVSENQQTIITTVDKHFLQGFKKVDKIDIK